MVCPYNKKSEKHVQQWEQTYDEDTNQAIRGSTVDKWEFSLADCQKDNCGAWQNGRCCYASVNLNNS